MPIAVISLDIGDRAVCFLVIFADRNDFSAPYAARNG
jgi:hypothetical protein